MITSHFVKIPAVFILLLFISIPVISAAAGYPRTADGFILRVEDRIGNRSTKDMYVSPADLRRLPQSDVTVRGKPEQPLTSWTGVTLLALLEKYRVPLSEITKVSVSSSDGYMAVLTGELLEGVQTGFCATGIKGERGLPEKYGYMRLIFPDLRPMYWVNHPVRIEIVLGHREENGQSCDIYFPESPLIASLFEGKRHIPVGDLLHRVDKQSKRFYVLTGDSLFREYLNNRVIKYMVLQKDAENTYQIGGVNVPTGLRTKQVFFLLSNNTLIFLKELSSAEAVLWEEKALHAKIFAGEMPEQIMLDVIAKGASCYREELQMPLSESIYVTLRSALGKAGEFEFVRLTW